MQRRYQGSRKGPSRSRGGAGSCRASSWKSVGLEGGCGGRERRTEFGRERAVFERGIRVAMKASWEAFVRDNINEDP